MLKFKEVFNRHVFCCIWSDVAIKSLKKGSSCKNYIETLLWKKSKISKNIGYHICLLRYATGNIYNLPTIYYENNCDEENLYLITNLTIKISRSVTELEYGAAKGFQHMSLLQNPVFLKDENLNLLMHVLNLSKNQMEY